MRNGLLLARNEVGNVRVILGPDASLADCTARFKELAGQPGSDGAEVLELHAIDGNSLEKRLRLEAAKPAEAEPEEAKLEEAPRKVKK